MLMTRTLLSISLIFAASKTLMAQSQPNLSAESKVTAVEMRSITFAPKTVTIEPGQAIIWKNVSLTDHSATSSDEAKPWDTTMVAAKTSSKPISFDKEGEYQYHCKMHGRTMSGLIVVKAKK